MPKVLIVAYYFPPLGGGGTQRTLKFTRYLPDFGWEPHVLTVKKRDHVLYDETLAEQLGSQARLIETSAFLPAVFFRRITGYKINAGPVKNSLFNRLKKFFYTLLFVPDEFIGWYPFAVRAGIREVKRENIDVIFSTGPPNTCHLIARSIARKMKRPWIADLRDLWNMYPHSYNPFQWQWRWELDEAIGNNVLASASRVLVTSPEMRNAFVQSMKVIRPARVHVLTNGFDPEDFPQVGLQKKQDKFTVACVGSLFPWRPIAPFLAAMSQAIKNKPYLGQLLKLQLVGSISGENQHEVKISGLSDITEIIDYQNYQKALHYLSAAQLLLLIVGEIAHAKVMIPGKIFDYLGARKPILAIGPNGAARRLVEEEQVGIGFAAAETGKMASALEFCVRRWQANKYYFQAKKMDRFHRRNLTRRLTEIFTLETQ